jgi:hypothetical protein
VAAGPDKLAQALHITLVVKIPVSRHHLRHIANQHFANFVNSFMPGQTLLHQLREGFRCFRWVLGRYLIFDDLVN